jgi:hypothetical protein
LSRTGELEKLSRTGELEKVSRIGEQEKLSRIDGTAASSYALITVCIAARVRGFGKSILESP